MLPSHILKLVLLDIARSDYKLGCKRIGNDREKNEKQNKTEKERRKDGMPEGRKEKRKKEKKNSMFP